MQKHFLCILIMLNLTCFSGCDKDFLETKPKPLQGVREYKWSDRQAVLDHPGGSIVPANAPMHYETVRSKKNVPVKRVTSSTLNNRRAVENVVLLCAAPNADLPNEIEVHRHLAGPRLFKLERFGNRQCFSWVPQWSMRSDEHSAILDPTPKDTPYFDMWFVKTRQKFREAISDGRKVRILPKRGYFEFTLVRSLSTRYILFEQKRARVVRAKPEEQVALPQSVTRITRTLKGSQK